MKIRNLLLILLLLLPILSTQAQTYNFSKVENRIQGWIDKGYYSGLGLIIVKDNKVLVEKCFGNYTPQTQIYIASSGKWVAAALMQILVDEGKISWNDKVSKWIPEMKDLKGQATIRQLYAHTSGIPNYQPKGKHNDDYQTCKQSVDSILPLKATAKPDSLYNYGGLAMQVAGRIAELATGKDWETLFQEKLAKPLKMTNSHFTPVDAGHTPMIAGGMRSTLPDYNNFLSMIYNKGKFEGKPIISEKGIKEMQANQMGNAKLVANWEYFVERGRGMNHKSIYGLGEWREILDNQGNVTLISSPSWAGMYPFIDKTRNMYGIVFTHVQSNKDGFNSFYASPTLYPLITSAIDNVTTMTIKTGKVEVGDATLYYETAGEGESLILLHGHSFDCRMWDLQFLELAKKYKVIRYDLRGYGQSSMPQEMKPFLHVDDLKNLMKALNIDKAHIVGLSLGGYIATEFLLKYPESALSVSSVSGAYYNHVGEEVPFSEAEIAQRRKEIAQLKEKDALINYKLRWLNALVNGGGSNRESMRFPLWAMINDWQAWQALNIEPRLLIGRTVPEKLKKSQNHKVPFLVLQGEIETRGKNTEVKNILAAYPEAKYVVIKDAGHMVSMEKPKEFNQALFDFLKSVKK